jgi:hypothetical protein
MQLTDRAAFHWRAVRTRAQPPREPSRQRGEAGNKPRLAQAIFVVFLTVLDSGPIVIRCCVVMW